MSGRTTPHVFREFESNHPRTVLCDALIQEIAARRVSGTPDERARLDCLLDPTADASTRRSIFDALLDDLRTGLSAHVAELAADDGERTSVWNETFDWGADVLQAVGNGDVLIITPEVCIAGRSAVSGMTFDPDALRRRAVVLGRACGVAWNANAPVAHLTLATETHISLLYESLMVCIRCRSPQPVTLDGLAELGVCNAPVTAILQALVRAGCCFLLSAEHGIPADTLLQALLVGADPTIVLTAGTDHPRIRPSGKQAIIHLPPRPEMCPVLHQLPADILLLPRLEEAALLWAEALETGLPSLAVIAAASPPLAVQRATRLLAGAFAIDTGQATHLLAATPLVIVQLARSPVGGVIIEQVSIVNGMEMIHEVRLEPLVTAQCDGTTVSWRYSVRVEGDRLVWAEAEHTVAWLAERLTQTSLSQPTISMTANVRSKAELIDPVRQAEAALQAAIVHRDAGHLRQAVNALRSCAVEGLPYTLARTVFTARRSLLSQLVEHGNGGADAERELEDVSRRLERLGVPSAASAPTNTTAPTTSTQTPAVTSKAERPLLPTAPDGAQDVQSESDWLATALRSQRERDRLATVAASADEDVQPATSETPGEAQ